MNKFLNGDMIKLSLLTYTSMIKSCDRVDQVSTEKKVARYNVSHSCHTKEAEFCEILKMDLTKQPSTYVLIK